MLNSIYSRLKMYIKGNKLFALRVYIEFYLFPSPVRKQLQECTNIASQR